MDDSPYILHHLDNEDYSTQGSQLNSFNMPFTYIDTQLPQIIFHYENAIQK
jgi:hypothetical protein